MECRKWSEEDWETLLYTIQQGNCILMLGPDASAEQVNGQWRPLTEQLAHELFEALEPEVQENVDATNLAQVAQYYVIQKKRNALNAKVHFFYESKQNVRNELYTNLAAFPFYLTITSTPDSKFFEALKNVDKDPIVDRYNFRGENRMMVPEGNVMCPLIYHLYGIVNEPDSLVLTEIDLIDFLAAVIAKNPPLPNNILSQLRDPNKSLLFLGFGLKHWYLRILLHVLYGRNRESSSFALERCVPSNVKEFQQAILFFSKSRYNIQLCEQDLLEFVGELRQRYEKSHSSQPISFPVQSAPTVYICHAPEHTGYAENLYTHLEGKGFRRCDTLNDQRISDEELERVMRAEIDYVVVLQSDAMFRQFERAFGKTYSLQGQARKKNSFNWLHLTDLHRGMREQHWLWPGVREIFFDDLKRLHEKCGPWDLVLFSGDLTQRGSAEEFQKVDELLEQLWEYFKKLGSSPMLLAVPGNHDLVRPDRRDPSVRLLQQWGDQPEIRKEFWEDASSPYRHIITQTFEPYTAWWQKQQFRVKNINPGILPGDFSASIKNNGAKLGIIGLNSSFLQLTDDDYEGKLVLHARQFHEVCDGDGPAWTKQHHTCLLLTHHPPVWLNPDSQQHLKGEITAHGRFVVHICGHMHETLYREMAEGGTQAQRIWQGHSLFGLEYFGEQDEGQRLHGYTAGRIELSEDRGVLRFWPREARLQGAQRKIVPDYSLDLTDDQHTSPGDFQLLRPYKEVSVPPQEVSSGEPIFSRVIRFALERQKDTRPGTSFIIPAKIEACPDLQELQNLQVKTIDLSNEKNVELLIREIRRDQQRRKRR